MNGSKRYDTPSSQSFQDDLSEAQRVLREAIEQGRVGVDGLHAARFQLLKLFGRIERMGERIDEAFAGQPFLYNAPANAPANTRRFNAYLKRHTQVAKLLTRALELWMLTCGMKTGDDWVPLLILEAQQKAAAKAKEANTDTAVKNPKLSAVSDPTPTRSRVC